MLVVMLLKELREAVLEANLELVRRGLVVIKPSGVEYGELRPADMVVTDLDGRVVDGALKPSSDLETHTLLYREFPAIGAVVHTHSEDATSFAQAGMEIPALGTRRARGRAQCGGAGVLREDGVQHADAEGGGGWGESGAVGPSLLQEAWAREDVRAGVRVRRRCDDGHSAAGFNGLLMA